MSKHFTHRMVRCKNPIQQRFLRTTKLFLILFSLVAVQTTVASSAVSQSVNVKSNNTVETDKTALTTEISTMTAQQDDTKKRISGTVLDTNGDPIIGANIVEQGVAANGTITNSIGAFSLTVNNNARIRVSYIGYVDQIIDVTDKTNFSVALQEDAKSLNELVVVGFGSQKKENLTGAVSQVKMEDVLGSRPVINAMSALQGSMPGLQITSNAGPGQSKSFNIRGFTSITGGSPLVLIDNVPGDIDLLNPEDIESVSTLKDASSSAIYGARAAFGVILITTKKAKQGDKFQVSYNNNFGFLNSINNPTPATAMQWLQAYKDGEFNAGSYYTGQNIDKWMTYLKEYQQDPSKYQTYGDGVYVDSDGVNYYLNEKNVYTNVFDKFGFLQSHNASMSGASDKISYRMSLGYNGEQGPLITDKDRYSRISVSSYIQSNITSWLTQALDVRYSQSERNMPETPTNLYDMRLPTLYPEGNLTLADGRELPTNTPKNMLLLASDDNYKTDNTRIFSKTTIKPLAGLEMVLEYTFDKKNVVQQKNHTTRKFTSIQLAEQTMASESSLENNRRVTDYSALNAYAIYSKSLSDVHNFKIMAGYNQESSRWSELKNYAFDLINEDFPAFSLATGEPKQLTDNYIDATVRGVFYRLNYDYKGRYLFETNGRYDGSSKFPAKNRFGFFPSFSLGWNVAKEAFMRSTSSWLDEMKPRISWGQIGNQNIDSYAYYPSMEPYKKPNEVNWIYGTVRPVSLKQPGLVRDNFTWETVETLDFGFDATLLSGRFRLTYDWYRRDTKDMLAPGAELPSVLGASAPLQNVADLRTKGWEINMSWRDKIGNVGYSIGFNVYDARTFITKYSDNSGLFYDMNSAQEEKRYRVDMEVGEIWGYTTNGYYTIDDFVDTNTWQLKDGVVTINGVNPRPGDIKFKNLMDDASSTNRIDGGNGTASNPGDRSVIGNSQLRFQYGVNMGLNYYGFDLSILLQGVGKRDVWLSDARRWAFSSGQFGQIFNDQLDYWKPNDPANGDWTPVNPNAQYFRIYDQRQNAGSNTRIQTKYLLDGSYMRIKNITLGYTFPKKMMEKARLTSLKVFASCENLHTFSSLPEGYDPERLSWGYPFYRTISFGLNVTL